MSKKAIGFIDSGVGGLTVVKQAMKQLPNESIYYLGDSARCPYGPRPKEEVIQYTWEMTQFLLKKDIKMLVIACNTATAAALDVIRERIDIPVIGVINPGSRAAIRCARLGTKVMRSGINYLSGRPRAHGPDARARHGSPGQRRRLPGRGSRATRTPSGGRCSRSGRRR